MPPANYGESASISVIEYDYSVECEAEVFATHDRKYHVTFVLLEYRLCLPTSIYFISCEKGKYHGGH